MEIIDNKALVLKTRDPDKVTQVIPQSHVVSQTQTPSGVCYEVAVKWTLANAKILQNLGFKNVPSPIVGQYNWPGMYKPFEHQKDTASFLTLNQRAFCLNDMGCVDSETEYLSPTGWKKISEYLEGDVAQYLPDTGEIEFVPPEAYVKKPCTDMIHFKTKYGVDQMLSPEHRMLISDNASKTNKTAVMSAAYMQYRHDAKHRKEKIIHGRDTISFAHATTPATYIRPWGQGLAITDAELRLQVAVIADGHFSGNTTRCVMRLKKERKVERLREILKETGITYVETTPEYESAEGFHIFKFDSPIKLKEFDERFYKCSAEQIDIIYNEVLHWDGCIRKGIKANEFSSTSRVSADFVQMVFNSKGHIARITEDKRENRNTCYNVTIRELGKQHLGYYSTTTKTVFDCKSTDGFKYCFTVPSTFLLFRRNGCVFASGNTGKTMSVIWAADYLMTKKIIKRVLVICPLSIMDPAWRADLFKTAMHRMVDIAHGSRDKRIKVIKSDAEFVIINYDGIEIVANEIAKGGFDLIVCDEASALKTPTTKRWKTLNSLITQHTWLWLLTGTPAAQSPMDAYGLAKILRPDSVPRYIGAFKDKVMLKITQFKYIPRPEAQDIVYKVLQPAIRYTKEECLDLPELTYTERDTPITPQQRKYYDLLKKELLFEAAGEDVSAVNAAVKMNKLLQISSGAAYSDTGEVVEFDCSVRLKEMTEIIEQSSHKVLIFANFKHGIVTIKRHLDSLGITSDGIHGGVSANNRTKIFNQFQLEKDPQVLIIQPKATAHGVTLHAANTIIWWGPITSTETYLQANARVHRQGQKNPCTVVHLVGSSVERSLYASLTSKTEAQNTLLNMYKNIFGLI